MTDTTVLVNGRSAGPTHQGGFYRFRYDVTELLALRHDEPHRGDRAARLHRRVGEPGRAAGRLLELRRHLPARLPAVPARRAPRPAGGGRRGGRRVDARRLPRRRASPPTEWWHRCGVCTASRSDRRSPRRSPPARRASGWAPRSRRVRPWTAETPHLYRVDVRLLRRRPGVAPERDPVRLPDRGGARAATASTSTASGSCSRAPTGTPSGRTPVGLSPSAESRQDIVLMKQMNMNAVRMSHYPPDVALPGSLRRAGPVRHRRAGRLAEELLRGGRDAAGEVDGDPRREPPVGHLLGERQRGRLADRRGRRLRALRPAATPGDPPVGDVQRHQHRPLRDVRAARARSSPAPPSSCSTEMLHALYDGGGGAGLSDYWDLMGTAPLSAGGFIWALVDEGIVRDDKGGVIDVNSNNYPDGILGPYREKEGQLLHHQGRLVADPARGSPILRTHVPGGLRRHRRRRQPVRLHRTPGQCRFSWQLVNYSGPKNARTGHQIAARADIASPDIAPGASGTLRLKLPAVLAAERRARPDREGPRRRGDQPVDVHHRQGGRPRQPDRPAGPAGSRGDRDRGRRRGHADAPPARA